MRQACRSDARTAMGPARLSAPSQGPDAGCGMPHPQDERELLGGGGLDRDHATPATLAELHDPGPLGEDRVVLADAHALARVELRAALADDDLASRDGLAGEHLHAEALGVRVAPVAAGAEPLLMSHPRPPPASASTTIRTRGRPRCR